MSSKAGGAKKTKTGSNRTIIADNRKARYNFEIMQVYEAGIMLVGTEVKSLRESKANIAESYVTAKDGDLLLINSYVPEYKQGNRFNHEPRRHRKLLMHAREIEKLAAGVQREGLTIVPLKLYFNERGMAKVEIGLAKGKKLHDKRQTEKNRDWQRDKARLMRDRG